MQRDVQRCGVVGNPIAHSLSPVMQSAALSALGLGWEYRAYLAQDGVEADELFGMVRSGGLIGLNVTTPYKQRAFAACDQVGDAAAIAGGVNTLRLREGELYGDNTDGEGVVLALIGEGFDPRGKRVAVLGTGATATAIGLALGRAGASEVTLFSRTYERATAVVDKLQNFLDIKQDEQEGVQTTLFVPSTYETAERATAAHAIINATPLGMKADDPAPLDATYFGEQELIFDVVYGMAHTTQFIQAAREAHIPAVDGRGMLVEQGARSLSLWTGIPHDRIPRDAMRRAVDEALAKRLSSE